QSHRVHHSVESRHADTNFGVSLSIWDHLFGTQYRHYDEYPETGVPLDDFPVDRAHHRFGVIGTWAAQVHYPFRGATRRTAAFVRLLSAETRHVFAAGLMLSSSLAAVSAV